MHVPMPRPTLTVLTLPAERWLQASRETTTTLDAYTPLLTLAVTSAGPVRVPAPTPGRWAVEARDQGDMLAFHVAAPDRRVIFTAAVAAVGSPMGQTAWDFVEALATRRDGPHHPVENRHPTPPWLIECLRPPLRRWPEAVAWLPSFSRAFAWCWLEG